MAIVRCLLVANLSDKHHVGVRAQDAAERGRKGQAGLAVHLPPGLMPGELVLDRVLDRDHVLALVVDDVQRGVQGGGLAGTGRPSPPGSFRTACGTTLRRRAMFSGRKPRSWSRSSAVDLSQDPP